MAILVERDLMLETNAAGAIALPFGRHQGRIEKEGYASAPFSIELSPASPDATLELARLGEVLVRATDESGAPVAGIEVLLVGEDAPPHELRRGGFEAAEAYEKHEQERKRELDRVEASPRIRHTTDADGLALFREVTPRRSYRIAARAALAVELEPPFESPPATVTSSSLSIEGSIARPLDVSGLFEVPPGVRVERRVRAFQSTTIIGRFKLAEGDALHAEVRLADLDAVDLDGDGAPDVGSHRIEARAVFRPDGSFRFDGVRGNRHKAIEATVVRLEDGVAHVRLAFVELFCEAGRTHDVGVIPPLPGRTLSGRLFLTFDGKAEIEPAEHLVDPPQSLDLDLVDVGGVLHGAT
ncbi:MAG TPA: hypothetical protein VK116_03250, partial [Planctomycetota bacterium]|nr:hypothetical protein [Planctomycetota bacterium]